MCACVLCLYRRNTQARPHHHARNKTPRRGGGGGDDNDARDTPGTPGLGLFVQAIKTPALGPQRRGGRGGDGGDDDDDVEPLDL